MKKIVLIGAGGHCKVIIDVIKSTNQYEIVGITDKFNKGTILGIPIIGDDSIIQKIYNEGIKHAFIAIGAMSNMEIRNNIYKRLKDVGFDIPILIHKTATVSPYSNIGEGTCVMAGAIINPAANVGKNSIINTASVLEHDCIIGDNTHISPNAVLGGAVKIGDNTHIGIGSSIIQGVKIGKNVTVGAGAVVIKNLPDNTVAVGVPAKVIKIKDLK